MRKFNVTLNQAKLETKRIQLAQLEAQVNAAREKVEYLNNKFQEKQAEFLELESTIQAKIAESSASS